MNSLRTDNFQRNTRIQSCNILNKYGISCVTETGFNKSDSSEYLKRAYDHPPIHHDLPDQVNYGESYLM